MRKIFVLGDSISMQYGPPLRDMLAGFWEYDRKRDNGQAITDLDQPVGGNGGDSSRVLAYLLEHHDCLSQYDRLLINCGLHDIKTAEGTENRQIDLPLYEELLEEILSVTARMGVRAIWVRTTPVDDALHNRVKGFHRFNRDVVSYNGAADRIMKKNNIPILDLYGFTLRLGEGIHLDGVHFTEPVRRLQAAYLAGALSMMEGA